MLSFFTFIVFLFFIVWYASQQKNKKCGGLLFSKKMTGLEKCLLASILLILLTPITCSLIFNDVTRSLFIILYINLIVFLLLFLIFFSHWKNYRIPKENDPYTFSTPKFIYATICVVLGLIIYLCSIVVITIMINKNNIESQKIKERYSEESEIKPSYDYIPPPVPKVEPPKQIQIKNDLNKSKS
jgi:hypothetical protein